MVADEICGCLLPIIFCPLEDEQETSNIRLSRACACKYPCMVFMRDLLRIAKLRTVFKFSGSMMSEFSHTFPTATCTWEQRNFHV